MAKPIVLPGGMQIDEPDANTQALLQQLAQVVVALNNISGQLDMQIRLFCGAALKSDVKNRIKAFDEAQKAVRESAAATPQEDSAASE